jgi:serralysin
MFRIIFIIGVLASTVGAYVPATTTWNQPNVHRPVNLSWSIVRDGTTTPDTRDGVSNLIAYLDGKLGAGLGGTNLTQRPWFRFFQDSFDRWEELGGINFTYSAQDDGSALSGQPGQSNVRGDIRIGGTYVDGPSSTLAYTYLPTDGDMVFDTGESTFYSDPSDDYRPFRNTVMHELGHAFGLLHIESSTSNVLMEPFSNEVFDGPQLDDIRGIHGLYGDVYEKTFNNLGNGIVSRATAIGALSNGGSLAIGTSAITSTQEIAASAVDFVSIADNTDADVFSFTITAPLTLSATLTPRGGVFNQGVEGGAQSSFNANARNNLSLTLLGSNGATQLGSASSAAAGVAETLTNISLSSAGTYYVRVQGADANVQLYDLRLAAQASAPLLAGDYNNDGAVNASDYAVWRDNLGLDVVLPGDTTPGNVSGADYNVWVSAFGNSSSSTVIVAAAPEPTAMVLVLGAMLFSSRLMFPRSTNPVKCELSHSPERKRAATSSTDFDV